MLSEVEASRVQSLIKVVLTKGLLPPARCFDFAQHDVLFLRSNTKSYSCFGERLMSFSTSAVLPEMAGSAGLAAFSFSVSFL